MGLAMTGQGHGASPAAWMAGGVGIFAHVRPDGGDFGFLDHFDAEGLARQVAESGARWFILTLGQNTGYYIAPNAAYERIAGYAPFSHCSRRDIPGEIAAALRGTGVRFGLYATTQPANRDRAAGDRFGLGRREGTVCEGSDGSDRMLTEESVANWSEVVEEWSRRYGRDVALWWFDGCYPRNGFDDSTARRYKAAARAGNPDAAVAFNAGVRKDGPESQSDYFGGETNEPFGILPESGPLDARGRQWHCLTYMGRTWGESSLRFADAEWRRWLAEATSRGGAVTLDLAAVRPSGLLEPAQLEQFRRVATKAAQPCKSHRIVYDCPVCGCRHDLFLPAGADPAAAIPRECYRFRPVRDVEIDGAPFSLPPGRGIFDFAALFPGAVAPGRNGARTAEIAFTIHAGSDGPSRVFRHNDYFGEISVNGGPFMPFNGPFEDWQDMELPLRAGENRIRYRTRAGSGGKWTWGFAT